MRQVVLFEALHFLTRDDLDACQLASAFWSNTIVRAAKTLPLRYIHNVMLKECPAHARVTVDLADANADVDSGYPRNGRFVGRLEPLVPADDYADLLCLFDRSYVNRLCACLSCGGFLDYWLSRKDELTCRIGTLEPYHYIQSQLQSVDLDDACVRRIERIMSVLRPSVYYVGTYVVPNFFAYLSLYRQRLTETCVPHLKIRFGKFLYQYVSHESARKLSNLEMQRTTPCYARKRWRTVLSKLSDFLFRATGLAKCDIIFEGGAMDGRWIDSVIERFERAEHSVLPVASLSVTWGFDDDDVPVIRRLQRPSSTVAKPPRDDFVEDFAEWNGVDKYEESPVHRFSFRNVVCGKTLNVYKWTLALTTASYKSQTAALLFEIV
ncbi:hypothetical protein AAVH_18068 [Aphelenchoides avenae]|nr:hypothetical protein AAVH_18068 [Aphelenchus avenae]